MERYEVNNLLSGTERVIGPDNYGRIKKSRVLVVGAGGIGCELLKNLVLSGFMNIEVVDLDVIELSNLNRQFLFRREHIGQPKATVARDACLAIVPGLNMTAHCANIKDLSIFPLPWWQSFDIILSALDNLEARRWVNKMAVMAGRPIVESGTAGYHGQSSVTIPGKTECYDCRPHEPPKTFPVCTIRATPSTIIHCIVWAKEYLFGKLFSEDEASDSASWEGVEEKVAAKLKAESQAFSELKTAEAASLPKLVFDKVFRQDLIALAGMEELWKERSPPNVLDWEIENDFDWSTADSMHDWTIPQWVACFDRSLKQLRNRNSPTIQFDKDDAEAMAFVASAANLRAHAFGIAQLSTLFKATEQAGNIIPAIATTNAIAAALVTMQAVNVLLGSWEDRCATVYITHGIPKRVLVREGLEPPNPGCNVCGTHRGFLESRNISDMTIKELLDIISDHFKPLSMADSDDIMVLSGQRIIHDPEMTTNRTLKQLDVAAGHLLTVAFGDGLYHNLSLGLVESDTPDAIFKLTYIPPEPAAELGKRDRDNDADSEDIEAVKEVRLDDEDDLIIL